MTARSTETGPTTTALDALSSARRRYLLSVLFDRDEPTPLSRLATDVASMEHSHPIVTDDQVERSTVRLVHVDVPKLDDLGVVNRQPDRSRADPDAATTESEDAVALADHPMFEAEWVRKLLRTPDGAVCPESTLDRTLETLRDPRRRTVLEVLARHRGSVPTADLATMIVAAETAEKRLVDVTEDESRAVEISLVHEHVPALADAGLVDADGDRIAIDADAPQFDADWFAASPFAEPPGRPRRIRDVSEPPPATTAGERGASRTGSGSCWTIEGRENVIARGHEIADGAADELFVTVPDRGLLQERCLERWSAAADRGVDVYVGSSSGVVRDVVGDAAAEITVCEPQFDWINFPTERLHPGRIVFADREAVMLVTLDEGSADGQPRPTAITGTGAGNALVLLAREHLGPRLDRLAARSDDEENGESVFPIPM